MRYAFLYDPEKAWEEQPFPDPVDARKINADDIGEYKALERIFACVCGKGKDNPPEMAWEGENWVAGGKHVHAHFNSVSVADHAAECVVTLAASERRKHKRPTLNQALSMGHPVVANLNMPAGPVRYNHIQHKNLDTAHQGGLTRSVPSLETLIHETNNRYAAHPIKTMPDLIKLMEKVARIQNGSLSRVIFSHGGGARALLTSCFDPVKEEHRNMLARQMRKAWDVIGNMQDSIMQNVQGKGQGAQKKQRKNLPTQLALFPMLVRVMLEKEEVQKIDRRAQGERVPRGDDPMNLRGHGGFARDIDRKFGHEVVCADVAMRNQIERGVAENQDVYVLATPLVTRPAGQNEMPNEPEIAFRVMPGMVHVGALPTTVQYALYQPYVRGDFLRASAAAPALPPTPSPTRRRAAAPALAA